MRNQDVLMIGAGVAGFALCVYILTYMTTRHEPVEWQNGDLVFQTATSLPNKMILEATASPLTNVGIVAVSDGGAPTVIVAGAKQVDEISMREFVSQGHDEAITAYRVRNMTPELGAQVVAAARKQLAKPYNTLFEKGTDKIYAGALVQLAYGEIGVTLGTTTRLEKLAKGQPGFEAVYDQQWSNLASCKSHNFDQQQCWAYVLKQQVVLPASIAADEHVALIYSDMPSVQALRPE
ncbi:MAG: hypothetical protein GC190_05880 [Alphaproteobacteria bacterium]|nr:hypothetical protein [Alphaproteobacteria bacterium]